MNQKDPIREAILAGCSAGSVVTHARNIRESSLRFTEEETAAIRFLRESETFKVLRQRGGKADRHDYKFLLARVTPTPITVCERAATKIVICLDEGLLDEDLNWNEEKANALYESMASSTSDKQGDDKGMYGIGDGGDKSEPKGQTDSGTSQKSDHGDHSRTAKSGYMSEKEIDEAKGKAKEAYEAAIAAIEAKSKKEADMCPGNDDGDGDDMDEAIPPEFQKNKIPAGSDADGDGKKNEAVTPDQAPKANMAPCPTNDGNTAAIDARYKHGAKQNESVEEMKARHESELRALESQQNENAHSNAGSGSTTADPKTSQPGTGSHGSKSEPPEKPGEADLHDPNYEKVKEQDPAHDPKNKGPAQATNESFMEYETQLIESLEQKGYHRGTPAWDRAYRRGFDMWITERAGQVNAIAG